MSTDEIEAWLAEGNELKVSLRERVAAAAMSGRAAKLSEKRDEEAA